MDRLDGYATGKGDPILTSERLSLSAVIAFQMPDETEPHFRSSVMLSELAIAESEVFEAMPVPGEAVSPVMTKSTMKRFFVAEIAPETMVSFDFMTSEPPMTVEFMGLETDGRRDRETAASPCRRLDVSR